jgi:hypothetical protein
VCFIFFSSIDLIDSLECIPVIHTNVSSRKHTKIATPNQIEANQQIEAKHSRAGSCEPIIYRGSILTSNQPHELCNPWPLLVGPPLPLPHLPSQCLLAVIQAPIRQLCRHLSRPLHLPPWPVAHHPEQVRPGQSATHCISLAGAVGDAVERQRGRGREDAPIPCF